MGGFGALNFSFPFHILDSAVSSPFFSCLCLTATANLFWTAWEEEGQIPISVFFSANLFLSVLPFLRGLKPATHPWVLMGLVPTTVQIPHQHQPQLHLLGAGTCSAWLG